LSSRFRRASLSADGEGLDVVVEEHERNLDVISRADWIIDGGRIVHSGTPCELLTIHDSRTAEYLARRQYPFNVAQ